MTIICRGLAALVAACLFVGLGAPAQAARPSVTVDRAVVRIGDKVLVTLHDWPSQRAVVISVCGNAARRGSVDCALSGSQGYGISEFDKVHATQLVITKPPAPCPCVVQVTDATQTEVALAPITIEGFASGPLIDEPAASPLSVHLIVRRSEPGVLSALRASLGGRTSYRVTVAVHNRSGADLEGVVVRARAGRSLTDQARTLTVHPPRVLRAGAMWTHSERVGLAAPVIGRFYWSVSASGAGPVASEVVRSTHLPALLLVLSLVLIVDVTWIVRRRVTFRFPWQHLFVRRGRDSRRCET